MMKFEYSGSSTEDILFGTPLILVSNGITDSVIGIQRSKIQSEISISRPVVNEYGIIGDHLVFTYSLIKLDGTPYTDEEQVEVERWLTSPKYSSELIITDDFDRTYSYFGLFTSTEWILGSGGFIMCTFTFEVNGFYPFKHYSYYGNAAKKVNGETIIRDEYDLTIDCITDELEEYIYPLIKITGINGGASQFAIQNTTDSYNSMEVTTESTNPIIIDCQRCIIKEQTDNGDKIFKYKDIGWSDIGKIYWPRLISGINVFHITGQVKVEVDFISPFKKVGGWLA